MAGTTARVAADLVGVNRKTAAYYFHRLREIITHETIINFFNSGSFAWATLANLF